MYIYIYIYNLYILLFIYTQSISRCADHEGDFIRKGHEENVNKCKYAALGKHVVGRMDVGSSERSPPFDTTVCICKGLLCNRHDEDAVMYHIYNSSKLYHRVGPAEVTSTPLPAVTPGECTCAVCMYVCVCVQACVRIVAICMQ